VDIDRPTAQPLAPRTVEPPAGATAPRTSTEQLVHGIWSSVLNRSDIGLDDDFFALGGHSILVLRIVARLRRTFATEIPMKIVFAHPTVARSAAEIEKRIIDEIEAMSDEEVLRTNDE
jgi:acyl carrier protein